MFPAATRRAITRPLLIRYNQDEKNSVWRCVD